MNNRAMPALISACVLAALTGCSTSTGGTAAPEPSPSATVGEVVDTRILPKQGEQPPAGIPEVKIEDLPESIRKEAEKLVPPKSGEKQNPNPERKDGNFSENLPENFTIPKEGTIFKPATVLDGDASFIALDFRKPWRDAVAILTESLARDGWTCVTCTEEVPTGGNASADWRYFMILTNGDRKLHVVIAEAYGITSASMNFGG